ncbi:hypothetical protein [Methylomonas sp. MK1]|uniref:hypothetical protein n=1 Tax=Methylomonas sp. MK1 TaxID=1131552 RepID=UPI00036E83A9|nr:hypothetical protein [Methylomonas sp. MK1]
MIRLVKIAFLVLALFPFGISQAALTLQQVRDKNPDYANLDDDQLANYLHKKFYSDIPFKDYAEVIGYQIPKNNSKVDDSETNSVHEHQIKLLDTLHPDWKEISKSEDFEKWTSRLSDEHRKMLSETWDAIKISEYITRYKKEERKEYRSQ